MKVKFWASSGRGWKAEEIREIEDGLSEDDIHDDYLIDWLRDAQRGYFIESCHYGWDEVEEVPVVEVIDYSI